VPFLIALVVIGAGFAAARREIPPWVPWLVPVTIGVVYYLLWRHEVNSDGGDPQPGLIKAVGIGLVVISALAILVGSIFRRSRR
jgi:hypothetical protein